MLHTIFLGTPEFAVPVLRVLIEMQNVVAVYTRPDRPAGRGRRMASSPVKDEALGHGIAVVQPKSLK